VSSESFEHPDLDVNHPDIGDIIRSPVRQGLAKPVSVHLVLPVLARY
jgi:hypothetical protein